MVKLFVMIPRAPHVSAQTFHDHWRHPHATLGLDLAGMLDLVQSHQIHSEHLPVTQSYFEGIGEAWFDTVASAAGMAEDPRYKTRVQPDEVNFIDLPRLEYLFTEEEVLVGGGRAEDTARGVDAEWRERERPTAIKLLQFVPRSAGPGWASDRDRELGLRVGALRHVRARASEAAHGNDAAWLGVRELWWATISDFEAGVTRDDADWQGLLDLGGAAAITMLAHAERWVLEPFTARASVAPLLSSGIGTSAS